jgi:hypothetical protein
LTAERTTSKRTGSISCEVKFCIFYRLINFRTNDVHPTNGIIPRIWSVACVQYFIYLILSPCDLHMTHVFLKQIFKFVHEPGFLCTNFGILQKWTG